MYAEDSRLNRVGTWLIDDQQYPPWFVMPWSDQPDTYCYNTVMHYSAVLKPYHIQISFVAPPAGTGRITFRVLLKVL